MLCHDRWDSGAGLMEMTVGSFSEDLVTGPTARGRSLEELGEEGFDLPVVTAVPLGRCPAAVGEDHVAVKR